MMPPLNYPPVERRRIADLLVEMIQRIPTQFPEWKSIGDIPQDRDGILRLADDSRDLGMVLLKLAARMGEITTGQLNRVPEKNFLAFLDFLGIDLRPPKSARVPLTFILSEKAPSDGSVPKGTRVGAVKCDDIVFETEEDLVVVRTRLSGAYSIDLQQDRYIDLSSLVTAPGAKGMEVFGDSSTSPGWLRNEHVIYLGHHALFVQADEAGVGITLTFTLEGHSSLPALAWEYSTFNGWKPAEVLKQPTSTSFKLRTLGIAPTTVQGRGVGGEAISAATYWVRAKTTEAVRKDAAQPAISKIAVSVEIIDKEAPAYSACFNHAPIDNTKDFFPFGERPKFNDTFYIASRLVFSCKGAIVTLAMVLSGPVSATVVGLDWEYWDGSSWEPIGTSTQQGVLVTSPQGEFKFSDTTNAFTKDGNVTFTCPPIKPTMVNGVDDYWIRIRIVSGDYGKEAGYRSTTKSDLTKGLADILDTDRAKYEQAIIHLLDSYGLLGTFQYVAEKYSPPSIQSLHIRYTFTTAENLSICLTQNSFVYRDVSLAATFQPFFGWDDSHPAFYLVFASATARPGTPLSMYVQVAQSLYGSVQLGQAIGSDAPPAVVWRYWDGVEWVRLPVEDETKNLTRGGLVRFIVPRDAAERYMFGKPGLWIRARLESGGYRTPPRLEGICLNTVWAHHGATFRDHILGSSNGDPHQTFQFSKTPVLDGQIIEVREPTMPTDADQQQLVADEGLDALRTVRDAAGNIIEVWVRWRAVGAMSMSTASDRHYVVDRAFGTVTFGDGVRGRIPPAGKANILAKEYRAGGGRKGSCARLSLTELKTTLPFIDKVVNYEAAAGGADLESLDSVAISGPRRIKSRDRAVTVEDYEWLAREAAGEVAKSQCLALTKARSLMEANTQGTEPGWITVIVVPEGQEDKPLPTEGVIKTVKDYLAERALSTLADRIDVIGPRYVEIDVAAEVVPRRIAEAKTVEKRVFDNLRAFLHPLSGGPDGIGWEFGRDIYLSEIAAVVQGTEGVDRVHTLAMKQNGATGPQDSIAIGGNELPASGRHTIVAVGA